MQNTPLVSIISPTYNHADFIGSCIESVICQTYTNWEMLIINDGSTDNSTEIIEQYIQKDSRIKLFNQENIGIMRLSETYNKAVSISSGKYLTILEGDDIINLDKLEKQVSQMEKNESTVLCWSRANTIVLNDSKISEEESKINTDKLKYFHNDPVGSFFNILFFENPIPAVTMMIRKDAILKIGGFIQSHNLPLVDLPSIFELAKIGNFNFIDEPLAKWRVYANQITKSYTIDILKGRNQLCLEQFDNLDETTKKTLNFDKQTLEKYYNSLYLVSYARSGRYRLIRKDFKGARKDYINAIFHKSSLNFTWRLRALTGFAFSLFNMDIEGLSKILGKKTYK